MDGDSSKQTSNKKEACNHSPNGCNVFQSFWIRHSIQKSDGLDRFLLDYGHHFLLPFGSLLHIVLFIEKIF